MRVMTGKAKGRRLTVPTGRRGKRLLRPLTGRAKGALFNILQNDISGNEFLDIFAGTGAVGIEALSRGAAHAVFIEKDHRMVKAIKENLKWTKLTDRADVISIPARRGIQILGGRGAQFGVIFVGAPYDSTELDIVLELIAEKHLNKPDGIVIAEHRKTHILKKSYGTLTLDQDRRYGDTVLSFYKEGVPTA